MAIWHIEPVNDLKEHLFDGAFCHCEPEIRFEEGDMFVIHNSYDGREGVELANEILDK